jgi:hypothetical protein
MLNKMRLGKKTFALNNKTGEQEKITDETAFR